MSILTNREYECVTVELGAIQKKFRFPLGDLWKSDNDEVYFALQDIGDRVLDLRVGDSLYFQPIRDDDKTKAILIRIK